jgi:prolyl-tRNA synthetase
VEDTPDASSIAALVDFMNSSAALRRADRAWTAADTLKNVVVRVRYPDGSSQPLVVGVPGDREVDMKRLEAQVAPAEVEPFGDEDFAKHPSLVKGYIGPGVLGLGSPSGIRYLVDPRVVPGSRWITGANERGKHVVDLVCGRDFTPDGNIEAAEVHSGDPCPMCGSPLEIARGIEIGHIFQLGRKYAEALGLTVLDQNGKQVVVTMGSYGIGVSRAVAAIAETCYDDKGLCWPREVAPADVHVVIAGKDDAQIAAAETLCDGLSRAGLRVLLDDRTSASPGVKFKDAELIGVPTIVVVGRGVADGVVEVKDRKTGDREDIAIASAVQHLVDRCRA